LIAAAWVGAALRLLRGALGLASSTEELVGIGRELVSPSRPPPLPDPQPDRSDGTSYPIAYSDALRQQDQIRSAARAFPEPGFPPAGFPITPLPPTVRTLRPPAPVFPRPPRSKRKG